MKPNATGSGFSYYTEQHSSHFHSWSSVTVWSSTQGAAPTVDSGVSWIAVALMAVVGAYLAIGAAFWARFSATRYDTNVEASKHCHQIELDGVLLHTFVLFQILCK